MGHGGPSPSSHSINHIKYSRVSDVSILRSSQDGPIECKVYGAAFLLSNTPTGEQHREAS